MPLFTDPSPDRPVPFGRYKLFRRIGAGGMGEVFLAREDSGPAPRACVVKKVLPNLLENRAFVGRFLDESKVVVRLKHPNIARVYAMGEVEKEYFLAMEYVQGKTVSRFTRRLRDQRQVMPLGHVLRIGERVCEGLAYAHEAKDERGDSLHLVHRDLSPANVCVSYRGEVKIIDFGAAQSTLKEEQTAPRVVIGNLTYMAPEQARKQFVDRRADIYATGVMLWELLAWHLLPQKGDPIERWRKAANPTWSPPSQHRPGLPHEVDECIMRALRREPQERWPNAHSLGAELRRLLHKFAPDTEDRDLGDALSRAFADEKRQEDELLAVTLGPITDVPTDKVRRITVVPPTALAFEHHATVVSDAIPEEETTDPSGEQATHEGTPTPTERRSVARTISSVDTVVSQTRVSFARVELTHPGDSAALMQEIEAVGADPEPAQGGAWRRALVLSLGFAVFVGACLAGFALIWFLGRS